MRTAYVLVEKPQRIGPMEDLDIDGRTASKWLFEN